ncbi:MAG: hypothetical protein H6755_05860 [Candidatus Omnitrophica bacterium]|nr:hypothetical protein [Candidatus Omnitrophota bacterium]MCB9747919.1 hypothetical protein [Candidatus Omnitrophota bacterium]
MRIPKTNRLLKLLIFMIIVSGCASIPKNLTLEERRQERQEILAKINLEDGIDYAEAEMLSGIYFFSFVSGCGMPGKIIDKGNHWETEMIVGIAAQKMKENLIIDKQTGKMSLKGWPTIFNPMEELVDPDLKAPIIAGPLEE